jgi:hypothetical protein
MNHAGASTTQLDEKHLGELAMRFRGTRQPAERQAIANDYSRTVERLIRSGGWQEMPPPDDQLPDAAMPKAFFDYWMQRQRPS